MKERLFPRTEATPDPTERFEEIDRIKQPSEVVRRLVSFLGAKITAGLGGVQDTRQVMRWQRGEAVPERIDALRAALRAAQVIVDADSNIVAQSWFMGANNRLGLQSPLLELRQNTPESYVRVVQAALAFAGM